MSGDHFYCLDFRGELAPGNYEREGITGYVYNSQQPGTIPIFRWYNKRNGDHFYTADPNGELAPQSYNYEGVGWYMFKDRAVNSVPLYRWYNPTNGDHFYTTDAAGELAPQGGYHSEGITGYLHPTATPNSVPLYRWYNSGLLRNFTFDSAITADQRSTLLERHTWAYYRAGLCGNLSTEEKDRVRNVYRRPMNHKASNDPKINAMFFQGQIWVNFGNLFPWGDDEIAQTLLHEMMHRAGYSHPERIDPPKPNADVPYDGGKYYGTPPLRAELCIAGKQSDTATIHFMLAPRMDTNPRACPVTQKAGDQREDGVGEDAGGQGGAASN
ncbi:hypothetical protein PCL_10517 [Purpureocillium lilacinum]|uniref:DUF5648 domain-containing protein n=1 Tax=Purpureocillium lilacinum TaxID=33203 RepID=A0A2U3DQ59_PURLI|nr:hypothetical protein PCL_10517 [Purpureocillium lilacinum]